MAKVIATGGAQAKSQIDTLTLAGTFATTETVTIKVAAKSVTYTCGAGETPTTVAAALVLLCANSDDPEFSEIEWESLAAVITATSTEGVPVTITASETAAAGTITPANVQAATGPNHWNNVDNWSTGAVPTTGDEVYIEDKAIAFLYGLPTSLDIAVFVMSAGQVGLPDRNGSGYYEYRTKRAAFTCLDVRLGRNEQGPSLCRLDLLTDPSIVVVFGSGVRNGESAIDIVIADAASEINVLSGQVGIAESDAVASVVGTIRVGTKGMVTVGEGVTLTTLITSGQTLLKSTAANVTLDAGRLTMAGSAAISTLLAIRGGTFIHNSNGTIAAVTILAGILDASQDIRPRTITSLTLDKDGELRDPYNALTITTFVKGTQANGVKAY